MLLQIFSDQHGYHFRAGSFSSDKKHALLHRVQPSYSSVRQAYQDAAYVMSHKPWATLKTAYEEEVKPVYTDLSGENMLVDHYTKLNTLLEQRIKDMDD